MKNPLKLMPWLLTAMIVMFAFTALAQTTPPVPVPDENPTLLMALVMVIPPLLIAIGKWALPKTPTVFLPIIAPALGALINWISMLAGGPDIHPVLAAALGSAGVGLREIKDQIQQLIVPQKGCK